MSLINGKFRIICNDDTICPSDWGMENEAATFHRIYYVWGGEAFYRWRGQEVRLKPDTLYLFPVLSPYTMWHNPADPLCVLWFHVESEQNLCSEIRTIPIEHDTALYHLLQTLRAFNGRPEYYQELYDCMDLFLRILSKRAAVENCGSQELRALVDFVEANVSDRALDVAALAAHLNMERASFSRKFKRNFQISPGQFIFEKKMNFAARALAAGASIGEAASRAGYLDEKAFSRAFKRYTESTPAEYRKKRAVLP